jgi:hypothetical protein
MTEIPEVEVLYEVCAIYIDVMHGCLLSYVNVLAGRLSLCTWSPSTADDDAPRFAATPPMFPTGVGRAWAHRRLVWKPTAGGAPLAVVCSGRLRFRIRPRGTAGPWRRERLRFVFLLFARSDALKLRTRMLMGDVGGAPGGGTGLMFHR